VGDVCPLPSSFLSAAAWEQELREDWNITLALMLLHEHRLEHASPCDKGRPLSRRFRARSNPPATCRTSSYREVLRQKTRSRCATMVVLGLKRVAVGSCHATSSFMNSVESVLGVFVSAANDVSSSGSPFSGPHSSAAPTPEAWSKRGAQKRKGTTEVQGLYRNGGRSGEGVSLGRQCARGRARLLQARACSQRPSSPLPLVLLRFRRLLQSLPRLAGLAPERMKEASGLKTRGFAWQRHCGESRGLTASEERS
jgi:hypothetical protein